MNYYERHLGDYAKDAGHLTMLEHGAYTLLLDRYYSTEAGIPADQAYRIARARTDEERAAVDAVLGEFFTLENIVWVHNRAEREIVKAQAKIKAAQENGRKGGRPAKNPEETKQVSQEKPTGLSLGTPDETQSKAHQTPDTRHQTPRERKASLRAADLVPLGVPEQVAMDFLEIRKSKKLPLTLTALQGLQTQAQAAGLSLGSAVRECVERGWATLRVEWLANASRQSTPSGNPVTDHNKAAFAEAMRRAAARNGGNDA